MDPSYKNSVSGTDAGGQPQPPLQPVFGAGVGSTRPPQQPAPSPIISSGSGPIPANESSPVSGTVSMSGSTPTPSGQMSTPGSIMTPPAPTAPNPMMTGMASVGSDTGDIILAPEKKSKKRILILAAAVVGLVAAIALAVFMLNRGGSDASEIEHTGLRGDFNKYANYFISGDNSTKDIDYKVGETDEEDGEEANNLSSAEIVYGSENSEEEESIEVQDEELAEEIDEEESVDGTEDPDPELEDDSYFGSMMWVDPEDRKEYVDNIIQYFDEFKKAYVNKAGEYANSMSFMEEYENMFYLVLISRGAGMINDDMILEAYVNGGVEEADKVINNAAGAYNEIANIYDTNYHDLILQYGEQELILLQKYNEYGCISGGEVDYTCVYNIPIDETYDGAFAMAEEYGTQRNAIIDDCMLSLYHGLYTFAEEIYDDAMMDEELNALKENEKEYDDDEED